MSTCARCGLPIGLGKDECGNGAEGHSDALWEHVAVVACRDRELANLRALLRSVTGKLEEARTQCDELDQNDSGNPGQIAAWIEQVLEALS